MSSAQPPGIPGFPRLADDLNGLKNRISPGLEEIINNPGCLRCTALLALTKPTLPHDLDQTTVGHWLSHYCVFAICCRSDQSDLGVACIKCLQERKIEFWVPQPLLPYACRLWEAALSIVSAHAQFYGAAATSATGNPSSPQKVYYGIIVDHFRLCADAWSSAYSIYKNHVLDGDDPLSAEAPQIQEWGLDQVHALNGFTPQAYADAYPLLIKPGAPMADPGVSQRSDIEQFRLWHQEYVAADASMSPQMPVCSMQSQMSSERWNLTRLIMMRSSEQLWRENLDYFDLAKTWIDQCSTSHKWCGSEKSYARPTRLISIEDKSIKLILTDREKWETTPRYATLSYCWGRGEFTKLTPENLHSFLANIPLEGLPKTFQDAVYITRKLGLKYLWIDALCIIQDLSDDADWLREAALMCSVYGGSHVNLAATHATSVHGGCFLKQEHHVGGFCAPVTLTTASTGDHSMVRNFYFQMVYEISVTETHLAGRAWALQERLLAPRTLSFGEEGMFWECRSNTASEFLPDGFRGKIGPKLVRPENSAWSWSEIVSHYSNAALTFGTDRLPALSGIATRQREITGDDYLAGMWRRDLVTQLLWVVRNPQKRKERPKQWRAPSWSWISVDGPTYSYPGSVDELKQKQKEYIYVLEAWTTPAGPDPCGQVDGGELSVGCSALVHARVQRLPEPPRKVSGPRVLLETGTLPVTISVDCLDDEASLPDDGIVYLLPVLSGESGSGRGKRRSDGAGDVPFQDGDSDLDLEDDENIEWFVELMNRGLVLQRCGDRKGHFRRIGSVDLCYDPFPDERLEAEKNRYYHELMAVIDRVGAVTAEAEAAKVVSNPDFPEARYVITIE